MYDRVVEARGAIHPHELLWAFLRLHSCGVWEHRQNLLRDEDFAALETTHLNVTANTIDTATF
ncbi:uncharacterized protein LOC142339321 isoform X4 [Convolutriloba macropyga]|uniref:uncharacterized protein LOC142339321 isoform X4 n=1 Tax=Convolutriloba macropyga TaxID=536237 RepID=UPI003F526543